MLTLGVKVRVGSGLGSGLEMPRVRNARVRNGQGTKCLEAERPGGCPTHRGRTT